MPEARQAFYWQQCQGVDTLNHNNPCQPQCGVSDITVSKDNKYLVSKDGVLYNKKMTRLVYYPSHKKASSFKVPDTIKSIGCYVFFGNRYLKKVVINEGLEKIKKGK